MSGKTVRGRQPRHADSSGESSPATSQGRASSSSQPSHSPIVPTKSQIDFQFLNFSHPSEARTGKTLKAIRSHVTKQQHQRENAAAAARNAKTRQDTVEAFEESPITSHGTPAGSQEAESSTSRHHSISSHTDSASPGSLPTTASPLPSPPTVLPSRLDLMEVYPEEWHAYLPRVLDHYLANLAVDNPDVDGPDACGLLRTRFVPFIMTDPASLHAVMLLAASHYGRYTGSTSHAIDLLKLRGMAISAINLALKDNSRATSDQLIAAVAKMASYEALFGDAKVCNTHMIALTRMVSLRGGLPALGLGGLLERLILWIDSNTSHYVNTHIYFDKAAFPTSAEHPTPDFAKFTGGLA